MFTIRALRLVALCSFFAVQESFACTTLVAGKKATKDGSLMCSHSNDGEGTTDFRFVKIPAAAPGENAKRPIFASPEEYPRYVGAARGEVESYKAVGDQKEFEPIGFIPQVNSTYGYLEQTYGVINDKQVGLAESTCSAVFTACPIGSAKDCKALVSIDQLSQIAMERASTSREAVQIMGDIAVEYGFYGPGSFEGGGETLLVIDTNEAFVFHILPDNSGSSAIWVAQRVPDDHVAVVANMFTIRVIDFEDSRNFLSSGVDMFEKIAINEGLWKKGEPYDFTRTFSDGEYAHKYYSGRRLWGAYRLLASNANLPDTYGNLKTDAPYNFSYPADKKLDVKDFTRVHRDWYGNTKYDMTVGMKAGSSSSPDLFGVSEAESKVSGNWERSITLYRTSDSFVVQARDWLPDKIGGAVWFGAGAAHGTTYTPFVVGMQNIPYEYSSGSMSNITSLESRDNAFWAQRYVRNLMNLNFKLSYPDVAKVVDELEENSMKLQASIKSVDQDFSKLYTDNAKNIVKTMFKIGDAILFKYSDGFVSEYINKEFVSRNAGYSKEWLEKSGYLEGPPGI